MAGLPLTLTMLLIFSYRDMEDFCDMCQSVAGHKLACRESETTIDGVE